VFARRRRFDRPDPAGMVYGPAFIGTDAALAYITDMAAQLHRCDSFLNVPSTHRLI
jgi:hypothetical protein